MGVLEVPRVVQAVLADGAKAAVKVADVLLKAGTSTKLLWNPEVCWLMLCGTNALAANAAPMVIPTMAITVPTNHNLADFRVKSRCAFRMVLLAWSWSFQVFKCDLMLSLVRMPHYNFTSLTNRPIRGIGDHRFTIATRYRN
jgi:hypothetical protein